MSLALLFSCLSGRSASSAIQAKQTLRIESLDVVKSHRTIDSIKVVLRNMTSEPQNGILWCVLSLPGEKEPWRVNEFATNQRSVRLAPGRTDAVEFVGPGEGLDGTYELSVWLHGVAPGTNERFHSDFRAYGEPVVVAPRLSFGIDVLGGKGTEESPLLVRFSVRNNETEGVNISLLYRITGVEEKATPTGPFTRTARIASGADYVVTDQFRGPLPRGRRRIKVTGWLFDVSDAQMHLFSTRERTFDLKD